MLHNLSEQVLQLCASKVCNTIAQAKLSLSTFQPFLQMVNISSRFLFLALLLSQAISAQNIQFRSKVDFPDYDVGMVWGYAADGREYAILGGTESLFFVDVTVPDAPQKITQLDLNKGFTRDVVTYRNCAYAAQIVQNDDTIVGITIVDLSNLPSSNLMHYQFSGEGATAGLLKEASFLSVDQKKGFLYLFSTNIGNVLVFDLKEDPYYPKYVGTYTQFSGFRKSYVENDTLYGVQSSQIRIIDMSDKSAPVQLAQVNAGGFNYNCSVSPDKKTYFLTSFSTYSPLYAYDISNFSDIKLLDKVHVSPGNSSTVLNAYPFGDYLFCAWQPEGVVLVNAKKPDNLVVVGKYDTYPISDKFSYAGCVSIYPYLPSGNIIVANNNNYESIELLVLTATFTEAAYLQGNVADAATGNPLKDVKVHLQGTPLATELTNGEGYYATGYSASGAYNLRFSKLGYFPTNVQATLESGAVNIYDAELQPSEKVPFSGKVTLSSTGDPIQGLKVLIQGEYESFTAFTNTSGAFSFPGIYAGSYDIYIGKWGYRFRFFDDYNIEAGQVLNLSTEQGFEDPFVKGFDYAWTNVSTANSSKWIKGEPISDNFLGIQTAPETDVDGDIGDFCFITGNSDHIGQDDVAGTATLYSPAMDLSNYSNPKITAKYAAQGIQYSGINRDSVIFSIQSGTLVKKVSAHIADGIDWKTISFDITDFVPLGNSVKMIVTAKAGPVEMYSDSFRAAFDDFKVEDQAVSTKEPASKAVLTIQPNPFSTSASLRYDDIVPRSRLLVYDLHGRLIEEIALQAPSGELKIGNSLENGAYFMQLEEAGRPTLVVKLIKTN